MPAPAHEIRTWILDRCHERHGVSPDRFTIERKVGARSWPQHAEVRADGKQSDLIVQEILNHIRDIDESATENREASAAVRIRCYRATRADGSHDFRWTLETDGEADGAGDSTDTLVAVTQSLLKNNLELSKVIKDQGNAMATVAVESMKHAAGMVAAMAEAKGEAAETKAALMLAEGEGGKSMDRLIELAGPIIPLIAAKLQAG